MAIVVVAGLGIVFAGGLTYFYVKFRVEENPFVSEIYNLLPGANCGSCGFAGCNGFAEVLAEKKETPEKCVLITSENLEKLSSLLGIEIGEREKKVARLFCFGGVNANKRFEYNKIKSCSAINTLFTTNFECKYGCIGYGDCVEICPVKAIKIGENNLPEIDTDICIGCGKCVKVCPKEAIKLEDNLAIIDYEKCDNCEKCVSECPRKIIFVLNEKVVLSTKN